MIKVICCFILVLVLSSCSASNQGAEQVPTSISTQDSKSTESPTEVFSGTEVEPVTLTEAKTEAETKTEQVLVEEQVLAIMADMSIEEKVGQLFYLDIQSYEITGIPAGGLIFFKNDLPSWEGTIEMIDAYQKATAIPLFIGIDEEGGIVTRISGEGSIGGTTLPSAWVLSHGESEMTVTEASEVIVEGLSDLGFNMNFAPVADINTNPNNPIIGKRAYSDLPEPTADFVLEALMPYEGSQVIPVVKHFPGHGNTKGDSHLDSVYVEGDLDALKIHELIPFQAAIDQGVEVVMMGHIKLPNAVISQSPASLNKEVIQGILRDQMGFEGLVISDSLIMASITNHYSPTEAAERGIEAGLNMLLMPEEPEEVFNYLVDLATKSPDMMMKVDGSVQRILVLKYRQIVD